MIELVRYHTWQPSRNGGYESAQRVALISEGHKWIKVLAIDATASGGLRLWKVKKSERQYMKPLLNRFQKPYNMGRALVVFRRMARAHGITKGAKALLKEASA